MLLLSLFICLVFLQIVSRQLAFSLPWTEELARYLFLWFILFGACHAARLDAFNRVLFQLAKLPDKLVQALLLCGDLIWLIFTLTLAWQGFLAVVALSEYSYFTPALDFDLRYVYLGFPLSFSLMGFRIFQQIVLRIGKYAGLHAQDKADTGTVVK